MQTSDRAAYDHWLDTSRRLHQANLLFAAGVGRCLPETVLLPLARRVGQLQEDESEALKALCVWRSQRPDRPPTLWRSVARDRVRVSSSTLDGLTLGS